MYLDNKVILITGANGLVGHELINLCLKKNISKIIAVDLKFSKYLYNLSQKDLRLVLKQENLIYLAGCEKLFLENSIDIVLHSAGVKGSPKKAKSNPADFFFPMIQFNTNIIKSAYDASVDWFINMSSVGVYAPSEIMYEDDVAKTMPSRNDWYPGWAKRMGEAALQSLKIQYNFNNWTTIRPANIYGKNDNFSESATVIASNIYKFFTDDTDTITCWGDGTPKRDFVYAIDVADACIKCVEKEIKEEINFGSGKAVSIKSMIDVMSDCYTKITGKTKQIIWDTSMPSGDLIRCLSIDRQKKYNLLPKVTLQQGIFDTMLTYQETQNEKK